MSAMPRRVPENCKLLFGLYEPPPLTRGDRATCFYRDTDVVITSWSGGRLSWPRCRAICHRGGSGLLVEEELARAILHESAAALMFWFGVANSTVTLWRMTHGVGGLTGTEGTRRLVRAGQVRRLAKLRAKRPPQPAKRRPTRVLGRMRGLQAANQERAWPAEHLALLGTLPDTEVAARTGRCENGVKVKRSKLGIPNPSGPGWTEEELALLGTDPDREVAERIRRTPTAVTDERCKLDIAHPEGWGWRPDQLALLAPPPTRKSRPGPARRRPP
jgi:hypothetical protein